MKARTKAVPAVDAFIAGRFDNGDLRLRTAPCPICGHRHIHNAPGAATVGSKVRKYKPGCRWYAGPQPEDGYTLHIVGDEPPAPVKVRKRAVRVRRVASVMRLVAVNGNLIEGDKQT